MRYSIQAKRKNTDEEWSAWTESDNYRRAEHHAAYVEEVGYSSKIVAEKGIRKLWKILGDSPEAKDTADAIYDAGFRLKYKVAKKIFEDIERFKVNIDKDSEPEYILKKSDLIALKNIYIKGAKND